MSEHQGIIHLLVKGADGKIEIKDVQGDKLTETKLATSPPTAPTVTSYRPKECHTGNFTLMEVGKAKLMIGGWSRGASYDSNTVVIDLANHVKINKVAEVFKRGYFKEFIKLFVGEAYDVLDFEISDFSTPDLNIEEWKVLAKGIMASLNDGHDVLIACTGGHGRTGTVASILMNLLTEGKDGWDDPVSNLRKIYCIEAVDTLNQEKYIYAVLGLDIKPDEKMYNTGSYGYSYQGGAYTDDDWWKHATDDIEKCPVCKNHWQYKVKQYGLCSFCQKDYNDVIKDMARSDHLDPFEIILVDPNDAEICLCGEKGCFGIHKCKCGHVVHNQPNNYNDICQDCRDKKNKKKGH